MKSVMIALMIAVVCFIAAAVFYTKVTEKAAKDMGIQHAGTEQAETAGGS